VNIFHCQSCDQVVFFENTQCPDMVLSCHGLTPSCLPRRGTILYIALAMMGYLNYYGHPCHN